jgi:hypothetical protein
MTSAAVNARMTELALRNADAEFKQEHGEVESRQ